jgi:glycosyltransferase involved in cell wall biosynthesis
MRVTSIPRRSAPKIESIVMPPTYLIDVSRLIWRVWSRRWPTGIDRVCLAYLDHFGDRAQAVVQHHGHYRILSASATRRLFDILDAWRERSRAQLLAIMTVGLLTARRAPPPNSFYLNVGHTGLDQPRLPAWIAARRLRAIYLVHDLIPLTHPQYCRAGEADKHELRMANVLASANGVIGNSEATLASLAQFAQDRGLAMPPAVAAWISGPPRRTSAPSRAPLATPYFVTLGTIEGRKNHLLLLDLWRTLVSELGEFAPTLVVIGQRGWEAGAALSLLDRADLLGGKLVELNHCDDEELASWIGGARALLMPSFAEGFGLPIIEALQLGTPVIASDLPVFREIARTIPTFLDPNDGRAWRRSILAFLGDSPERRRQIEQMKDYRPPDWDRHFAIVDAWLAGL